MKRHEFWRLQYREKRYARHLSNEELQKRVRDIVLNMVRLTTQVKIGLMPIDEGAVWMEKWTHVLEEMNLRFGPYPAGFANTDEEPFPKFVSDLGQKAAEKLSALNLTKSDLLIKFGSRKYIEPLYETGALRIQPATFFATVGHNGAVRDDELAFAISSVLTRDQIVSLVKNPQDVPPDLKERRVDVSVRWPSDYWLYCLTRAVEPRLFVDFDADACLIIRDRNKFSDLLRTAVSREVPSAKMGESSAIYIDPLLPKLAEIFVPLCKHFRYSYQDEYRYYWLPLTPIPKLQHIDVRIGSLKDISELVMLD